jgi:DNA-binding transcriptional LysR family regulator
LIARFQQRHPGVRVSLSVNNREVIVRELERNEIDVAIMGTPPQRIETSAVLFADHPLVVIAPVSHPLAKARRIPLSALAGETFIMREQGSGTRSSMERFFAERRFTPKIGAVMSSNETIKQAVMAAWLHLAAIGFELQMGRLVELDIVGLPLMRRWYVVHRAGRFMSRATLAFVDFVVEAAPGLLVELHPPFKSPKSARPSPARAAARRRGTRR